VEIVVRSLVIYVFLWLLLRALGKRELGEMSAFELLLLVVLGDIVQQGITQQDYSATSAMLAAGTIGLFILATSYVTFRSRHARDLFEGLPSVVVRSGRFVDEVIDVERLTHDEVLESARQRGIRDLQDVEVAILEPDGRLSFVLRRGEPPLPGPGRHEGT